MKASLGQKHSKNLNRQKWCKIHVYNSIKKWNRRVEKEFVTVAQKETGGDNQLVGKHPVGVMYEFWLSKTAKLWKVVGATATLFSFPSDMNTRTHTTLYYCTESYTTYTCPCKWTRTNRKFNYSQLATCKKIGKVWHQLQFHYFSADMLEMHKFCKDM